MSALRERLLDLCVDGNGAFSASMLEGLKTHVSLYEALEIEAIKCKHGDARHEYQEWYSTYADKEKARRSRAVPNVAELDLAVVAEELADVRTAIEEHEAMLAEHRLLALDGKPQLSDASVDGLYATIESLRANVPVLEATLQGSGVGGG